MDGAEKVDMCFRAAYVEFFCNKELLDSLIFFMPKYSMLSYHARNKDGDEMLNTLPKVQTP